MPVGLRHQQLDYTAETGLAPAMPESDYQPPIPETPLPLYSPRVARKPHPSWWVDLARRRGVLEPSQPVQGRRGRPSHLITPLARVMKSNGHTNPQVAKYLGVGLRTVEYWVVGEKVIPKKYLPGLCKLYNRDPGYFVYVDEGDGSGVVVTEESYRIAEEFFTLSYPTDQSDDPEADEQLS